MIPSYVIHPIASLQLNFKISKCRKDSRASKAPVTKLVAILEQEVISLLAGISQCLSRSLCGVCATKRTSIIGSDINSVRTILPVKPRKTMTLSYLPPSGFSPKSNSAVLMPRMSQSECARKKRTIASRREVGEKA